MEFDLEILSKSKTPFDYKQTLGRLKSAKEKGDFDNTELKVKSFNYVLMDSLTDKKSNCVRKNCVPIEGIPNENEKSTISKSYIQAYKTKAFKNGSLAISQNEWRELQIKVSNCFKRNQFLLKEIFKGGEYQKQISVPFNVETGNFLKKVLKSQKAVCNINLEVDFFKQTKKSGYVILFQNEKDINPEKIIYKIYDKGLDIFIGTLIEAYKKKYGLETLQVYILALENSYQSNSVMLKLNELSYDIGFDVFKKRIKTIYSSFENNNFVGFQKSGNPLKLNINQSLIKKRENESW